MAEFGDDLNGNPISEASGNVLIDACNNFIPDHLDASYGVLTSADRPYDDVTLTVNLLESTVDSISYQLFFPTNTSLENYTLSNPTLTLYERNGVTLTMIRTAPLHPDSRPTEGLSNVTVETAFPVVTSLANKQLYLEFSSEMVLMVGPVETDSQFINVLSAQFTIDIPPDNLVVQVLVDDYEMNYIDGIPLRIINPHVLPIRELWVKILNFDGSGALQSKVVVLNDTTDTLEADIFPIPQDASRNFQFTEDLVADTDYYIQVKAIYGLGLVSSKYTDPIPAVFTTRVGTIDVLGFSKAFDESDIFLPHAFDISFSMPFDALRYGRTVSKILFSHVPIGITSPFQTASGSFLDQTMILADEETYTVDASGVYTYRIYNNLGPFDASDNVYVAAFADTRYGRELDVLVPANTRKLEHRLLYPIYRLINQASDFDGDTINLPNVFPTFSFTLLKGSASFDFDFPETWSEFDLNLSEAPFSVLQGVLQSIKITSFNVGSGTLQGTFKVQLDEGYDFIQVRPGPNALAVKISFDGDLEDYDPTFRSEYKWQIPPTAVDGESTSITHPDPSVTKIVPVTFTKGLAQQDGTGAIVLTRVGVQDLDGSDIEWVTETSYSGTTINVDVGSWLRNKTILLQSYTLDINNYGYASSTYVYGEITTVDFEAPPCLDSVLYTGYNAPVEGDAGEFSFTADLAQHGMENGTIFEIVLVDGSGERLYYDLSNNLTRTVAQNPLMDSSGVVVSNALNYIYFKLLDSIENWGDFPNISVQLLSSATEQESPLYRLRNQAGDGDFVYTLLPVRTATPLTLTAANSIISVTFEPNTSIPTEYDGVESSLSYGADESYNDYSTIFEEIPVNLSTNTAAYLVNNGELDGSGNSYVQVTLKTFILDPNIATATKIYAEETTTITDGPIDFVFEPPDLTMAEPDKAPPQVTYTVLTTTPNNPAESLLNVNAIFVMTDASSAVTCFDVSPNTSYAIVVHKDAAEDPELVPCSVGEANVLYVRQPNLDYTERSLRVWFVSDASSSSYPTHFIDPSFVPALPENANVTSTTQAFQPYKQIELLAVGDYDVGGSERFDISMNLNGDFPKKLTFVYFYQNDQQYNMYEYENITPLNIDTTLSPLPMFSGTTTLNGVLALTMEWSLADNVAAIFVFGVGTGRPSLELDGYSFFGSYTLPYIGSC
jgi:hypothetical protein